MRSGRTWTDDELHEWVVNTLAESPGLRVTELANMSGQRRRRVQRALIAAQDVGSVVRTYIEATDDFPHHHVWSLRE